MIIQMPSVNGCRRPQRRKPSFRGDIQAHLNVKTYKCLSIKKADTSPKEGLGILVQQFDYSFSSKRKISVSASARVALAFGSNILFPFPCI